jgi:hypothetical protein
MRRSEVASKAAEYQRVIDGLAAAALAAAAEVPVSDSDHGVKGLRGYGACEAAEERCAEEWGEG